MAYEYRGVAYLRQKLNRKRIRVKKRYSFYEMKLLVRDLGCVPGCRRSAGALTPWTTWPTV